MRFLYHSIIVHSYSLQITFLLLILDFLGKLFAQGNYSSQIKIVPLHPVGSEFQLFALHCTTYLAREYYNFVNIRCIFERKMPWNNVNNTTKVNVWVSGTRWEHQPFFDFYKCWYSIT